jgi:hypothetical protein
MTGADWIAIAAIIATAVVAIVSITGQHRANLALLRFEERWRTYTDYIVWFDEHSATDQSGPPVELQARLLAWGSPLVNLKVTQGLEGYEGWTPATSRDLSQQIRREFETRRRPRAWGSPDSFAPLREMMNRRGKRRIERRG